MPLTIPPFDQYQQPVVPLRGLWNKAPQEGDMFANFEIDWLVTTVNRAVQIAFSANSPVAFSQIVALSVDNRRSGYDVNFVFPDSGFTLTVPAYNQGIYPVFTNALMFYVIAAAGVVAGNTTVFQVLNSMPPPVALNPTSMQTVDTTASIDLVNSTTQIIPTTISGTLNGFVIALNFSVIGGATLQLVDGNNTVLWSTSTDSAQGVSQIYNISDLNVRFVNGIQLQIGGSTFTSGQAKANVSLFYTTP